MLQRTALCAREIVAFLKAESVQLHSRSIGAPPLMPKALGRNHPTPRSTPAL
jgi:hypothetical protein